MWGANLPRTASPLQRRRRASSRIARALAPAVCSHRMGGERMRTLGPQRCVSAARSTPALMRAGSEHEVHATPPARFVARRNDAREPIEWRPDLGRPSDARAEPRVRLGQPGAVQLWAARRHGLGDNGRDPAAKQTAEAPARIGVLDLAQPPWGRGLPRHDRLQQRVGAMACFAGLVRDARSRARVRQATPDLGVNVFGQRDVRSESAACTRRSSGSPDTSEPPRR
jgi:hypothetical protein